MADMITPQNIDSVLNEVIKKLDEAEGLLNNPGCSTDEIGKVRNEALRSLMKAHSTIRDILHETYLLK